MSYQVEVDTMIEVVMCKDKNGDPAWVAFDKDGNMVSAMKCGDEQVIDLKSKEK